MSMMAHKTRAIKAILFDMDGTLIDSEPLAARTTLAVYQSWGIPLPWSESLIVTGKTWESAFTYLFQKYPPPMDHAQAAQAILDEYHRLAKQAEGLVCVEGAIEFIRDVTTHHPDVSLALVSGSHRSTILWVLEKLKILPHFSVILGAEDYPRSKPAPDGYLKALKLLNASAENAIVFEDSTAGIESAKGAGVFTVAITCTNHFQQNTRLADLEISNFSGWTWKALLEKIAK